MWLYSLDSQAVCVTDVNCLSWFVNIRIVQHKRPSTVMLIVIVVVHEYVIHCSTENFHIKPNIRKKFYIKCHQKFRIWFPSISLSLKLTMHWLVNKVQTGSLLMKMWQQTHVLSEETTDNSRALQASPQKSKS